jgi:hypothetical protein
MPEMNAGFQKFFHTDACCHSILLCLGRPSSIMPSVSPPFRISTCPTLSCTGAFLNVRIRDTPQKVL